MTQDPIKKNKTHRNSSSILRTVLLLPLLGACNVAERLGHVGDSPELSQIQNPTKVEKYQPVSMPMPEPQAVHLQANSLRQSGAKAFFKDQRATKVGDVVTVKIDIANKQQMDMAPDIQRASSYEANYAKLFGLRIGGDVKKNPPTEGIFPSVASVKSNPAMKGTGKYDIKDTLQFTMAAVVVQTLPNGSLVIEGRREMRLMNEVRDVVMRGIVRKEDILSNNTITQDKIAELRLSYNGRGDLSDVMRAPYGHQILTQIAPF